MRPIPLVALFAALAIAPPAHANAPAPSDAERAETRAEFLADAGRTLSDRSGDVFFLPKKYNFITGADPKHPRAGHTMVNGKIQRFSGVGISHGAPWTYDRDIPLVMWGPGFIQPNQVVRRRTQQQDLVPTYAKLINSPLPTDARGQVLEEALKGGNRKPKMIFTMVFDQAGESMYRLHPKDHPFIDRLKREGTYFANTRVSHLDLETAMGHVAIGTGAFPRDHGIPSNSIWHGGAGTDFNEFTGLVPPAPFYMMSPTLGDFWLRHTKNQALLFSYCWVDRAAMGMGGHGSFFKGNKKAPIYWLDQDTGKLTTNKDFYAIPGYVADTTPFATAKAFTGKDGKWMEHDMKTARDLISTPALPRWEGQHLAEVFKREPFGQDDIPDLAYVTLKSTDIAGHYYGQESEEVGAIMREQDHQFELLVDQLVKKVGRENLVVTLTADHGGPPLPELSGGVRLFKRKFLNDLNARFDRTPDGVPLAPFCGDTQLWLDRNQMRDNHVTMDQVKGFIEGYKVDGKLYFEAAVTRRELLERRLAEDTL
ncbi:MAG: hypothetical protein JWM80_1569 [Cyanobacteria bacterium RYN_339]|nr:hypothetical protein [Cyanobacteria bacterium RYN_339]